MTSSKTWLRSVFSSVDAILSWEPNVSIAAACVQFPCLSFVKDAVEETEKEPYADFLEMPIDQQILFTTDKRYGKPMALNATSLTNGLLALSKGRSSVTLSTDALGAPDILDTLRVLIQKKSSVIVAPLPWSQNGRAAPPHMSLVSTLQSVPAMTSDDIRSRTLTIVDSIQAFNRSLGRLDPLLLARFACYQVTNRSEPSDYAYGLASMIRRLGELDSKHANDALFDAVRYLVKETYMNGKSSDFPSHHTSPAWLIQDPESVFKPTDAFHINLDLIFRQSAFEGVHRSGWAYVKNGLAAYNHPDSTLFVDLYADATFGWMEKILSFAKALPFSTPWMAFFHHGWDTADAFSVKSAVSKPSFFASLPACKALFVLSQDLQQKLATGLKTLYPNATLPPIIALTHPTEFVPIERQFAMAKFRANPNRRVVQVGSFYRQSFAIYELPFGDARSEMANPLNLRKAHLQAASSHRYFCPDNLLLELYKVGNNELLRADGVVESESPIYKSISGFSTNANVTAMDNTTQQRSDNVYVQGLIDHVKQLNDAVDIIPNLSNDDYDTLLSENIVFVQLNDASAINTLLECLVRNTPILINPLPSVLEVLGANYPLYFSTLKQASDLLADENLIEKASQHLMSLNKSKYRLDYFLMHFRAAVEETLMDHQ